MTWLIWLLGGIIVFFGVHLIPACSALRARLVARLGESHYMISFAALSFAGLAAMVRGMMLAERVVLWQPPKVAGVIAAAVMLPALILIASVKFDNHIARATRNPMAWGFLLWAACHVFANGELDAALFFGAFTAYLIFYLGLRGRGAREFSAPRASWRLDALAVFIGVVAYSALAAFHHALFGAHPFPF